MSPSVRLGLLFGLAIAGGAGGYVIFWLGEFAQGESWALPTLAIIGAVLFSGVGALATRFKRRQSFVGRDGISDAVLRGGRTGTLKTRSLRFDDASELRVNQTRHFTNGVYTQTTYGFTWYGHGGGKLFSFDGAYRNKLGPPTNLLDAYWFGPAAERAWSRHYLERCLQRLKNGDTVVFRVASGGIVIELGPDFFALQSKGNEGRWSLDDLQGLSVEKGQVILTSDKFASTGWFARLFGAGRISFPYDALPNAKVFLLLFDNLVPQAARP